MAECVVLWVKKSRFCVVGTPPLRGRSPPQIPLDTIFAFLFQLQARLDNAEDTILVDTPLDIDPRTKNKKSEHKSEDKVEEEVVKKNEKISPDEFGKNEITFYRNDILEFCNSQYLF